MFDHVIDVGHVRDVRHGIIKLYSRSGLIRLNCVFEPDHSFNIQRRNQGLVVLKHSIVNYPLPITVNVDNSLA